MGNGSTRQGRRVLVQIGECLRIAARRTKEDGQGCPNGGNRAGLPGVSTLHVGENLKPPAALLIRTNGRHLTDIVWRRPPLGTTTGEEAVLTVMVMECQA